MRLSPSQGLSMQSRQEKKKHFAQKLRFDRLHFGIIIRKISRLSSILIFLSYVNVSYRLKERHISNETV